MALALGAACCLTPAVAALAAHRCRRAAPGPASAPTATEAHTATARHRSRHAHDSCRLSRRHRRKERGCLTRARTRRRRTSATTPARARHATLAQARRATGALRCMPKASGTARSPLDRTVSAAPPAATIASVLATPCQNTELTPEPGNLEQVDAATLCLVNQERARNNELPLQPSARLDAVAQEHSEDMVERGLLRPYRALRRNATGSHAGKRLHPQLTGGLHDRREHRLGHPVPGYAQRDRGRLDRLARASREHPQQPNIAKPESESIRPRRASLAEGQPGAVYSQEFGVIDELRPRTLRPFHLDAPRHDSTGRKLRQLEMPQTIRSVRTSEIK